MHRLVQENCQQQFEEAEKSLKTCQKAASSLRRAINDMKKLRTALNKLRVSLKNKQKASQESDNKIARTLAGRTSVAKSVNATDPLLLQSFKELMHQKEMRVIKDPAVELVNGASDASRPFVIRKGRNVMKYLARQDEVRAVLERTVDSFRDKLLSGSNEKAVPLGWIESD